MGVKPLFWTQRGSAVLFASELKALLASPLVPAEVDADGLLQLMVEPPPAFAPTPGYTPIRGVNELRPGGCATFDRSGAKVGRYWELVSKRHTDDLPSTVAHVRALLEAAVKRQLVSDVPLACLLSGGVDSSGISALASRQLPAGEKLHGHSGRWLLL